MENANEVWLDKRCGSRREECPHFVEEHGIGSTRELTRSVGPVENWTGYSKPAKKYGSSVPLVNKRSKVMGSFANLIDCSELGLRIL